MKKKKKPCTSTATLIIEHKRVSDRTYFKSYYRLFKHSNDDRTGRAYLCYFCPREFLELFPEMACLRQGHSIEVEITIKSQGISLPWIQWTNEEQSDV